MKLAYTKKYNSDTFYVPVQNKNSFKTFLQKNETQAIRSRVK